MSTKHTPGPWHADPTKSFYVFAHGSLAEQAGVENGPFVCNASTQANARLIAAAPDLLAALQNARNVLAGLACGDLRTVNADSPALAQARAAIAKATGADA